MAVTSQGYQVNKQPIAQSFFIDEPNGIYCTKVDLFFAARDDSLPVQIQIRPMVNGFPSSVSIIPGTTKLLPASSVNIDVTGPDLTPTTFEFDEPVFLKGQNDYALVVIADSKDYQIYIAEINEFQFGSTERRVNKQPVLGSLFYSQNGATFTPAQNQDLAFVIHQATFANRSGTLRLKNASVPKKKLVQNPFTTTAGTAVVKVRHIQSGHQVGDRVMISGVTAGGVGGISKANLEGGFNVTNVDFTGYTFTAGAAADSDEVGGGTSILASKNIPFSVIYPHLQTLTPRGTEIAAGIKTTTGKSYAGSETAKQKLAAFQPIKINENNIAENTYIIAHDSAETTAPLNAKSFEMQVNFRSTDSNVSPLIDLQRASVSCIDNIIDKQDSASSTGFNIPVNFVNETSARGGSAAAKHITRVVTLENDAVGLKILISANRPSVTDFQVYTRTATSDEIIHDKDFTLRSPEQNMPSDENPNIYREYRYIVGGQGGDLPAFTKFQAKIVFRSTNSAKVPKIRDLRIIALSV